MADAKIVAEYIVKTDKAVAELKKITDRLDEIEKDRKKSQEGFRNMSKGMVNNFKKVGAAIGLAFGAQELVSFGKEAVKLASQMEGVERAFKRIGGANSANLLEGLRKATRGTVSDIKLMTTAIQSANFQIPLENLAKYMQFAQQRARETGKSVDYLIDSILTGVGRGSIEVWDNMGFALSEVREKLNGVSIESLSVADRAKLMSDLVNDELAKMGDQPDTTADKLEKINAVMENMKVVAGEALINFGTGLLYLAGQVDTGIEATDGLVKAAENLSKIYEDDVTGAVDKMIQKNQELLANQLKIAELEETRSYQNSRKAIANINEHIDKLGERNVFLREYIKQLKAIYEASQQQDPVEKEQIKNLAYYNQLIKDLKAEQEDANTTRARVRELEDEINEAIRQRTILLGQMTAEMKKAQKAFEELLKPDEETDPFFSDLFQENIDLRSDGSEKIQAQIDAELEATLNALDEEAERREKLEEQREEEHKRDLERKEEAREFGIQIIQETSNLVSTIGQLQQQAVKYDLQLIEELYEQGKISRDRFERREREIKRKAAKEAKALAIFQAVVNTAVGVTQALSSSPPPYSYILAGISGALGAAQIAVAASEPIPKFAEGGFVLEDGQIKGRKHKYGGVHIEAEGGEFITSAKHAQQNADILKAINSGSWEKYKMENIIAPAINQVLEGGFEGMGASYTLNTNWTDRNLLKQGDRNRYAMRDGFVYLGQKIDKLNSKSDYRYV